MSMTFRLLAAGAAFAFAGAVFASPPSSTAGPTTKTLSLPQQRMSDCSKQATGRKGDDRKTFMSGCLKGRTAAMAAPTKMTQQQKMTRCNADAKTKALAGADRKTFMSACLKGSPAAR